MHFSDPCTRLRADLGAPRTGSGTLRELSAYLLNEQINKGVKEVNSWADAELSGSNLWIHIHNISIFTHLYLFLLTYGDTKMLASLSQIIHFWHYFCCLFGKARTPRLHQSLSHFPSGPGSIATHPKKPPLSFSLTESRIKPNILHWLHMYLWFLLRPINWYPLFYFWSCCVACRILVPWPGIKPMPLHWEWSVLTTGLPEKSLGTSSLPGPVLDTVERERNWFAVLEDMRDQCGRHSLSPQPNSEVERIILTHSFSNCLLSP